MTKDVWALGKVLGIEATLLEHLQYMGLLPSDLGLITMEQLWGLLYMKAVLDTRAGIRFVLRNCSDEVRRELLRECGG